MRAAFAGLLAGVVWCGAAFAQQALPPAIDEPDPKMLNPDLWKNVNKMLDGVVDATLTSQNWDSDPDHMWVRAYQRMQQAGPLDLAGRMNVYVDTMTERYSLNPEQQQKLQKIVIRDGIKFLAVNGQQLVDSYKIMQAEAKAGKPLTAENVQKLMQVGRPFMDALNEQWVQSTQEFIPVLDADQRKLAEEDLAWGKLRYTDLHQTMAAWEGGKWTPKEWGLTPGGKLSDMGSKNLEARLERGPSQVSPGKGATSQSAATQIAIPSPWAKLVDDYIKWYELDAPMQKTADKILQDVTTQTLAGNKPTPDSVRAKLAQPDLTAEQKTALQGELKIAEARELGALTDIRRRLERFLTPKQQKKGPPPSWPAATSQPGR